MADKPVAMRCSHCGINYPPDKKVCLVFHCKQPTWRAADEYHDTDWKEIVNMLNKRVLKNTRLPDMSADLIIKDGKSFILDSTIRAYGYIYSESGDILKINGDYFEIYGAVHPGTEAAGWWIEVIPIEGVFDNVTPEDIINPTERDAPEEEAAA